MKYIILGHSKFAAMLCEGIYDFGSEVLIIITLDKEHLPENSYDFKKFCKLKKIKLVVASDINTKEIEFIIKSAKPDFIISAWPKILKKNILQSPNFYTIGTHPTNLPMNKGRHPIHWSIVLGIKLGYLSFFKMNCEIDSGPILLKEKFNIGSLPIAEVMDNLENAARKGVFNLCALIEGDELYSGENNIKEEENFWRKRDIHDITLDVRMSGDFFVKTVKSFSNPYSGAILIIKNKVSVIIKDAIKLKISESPNNWRNREYGYIFLIDNLKIILKVSDSVLLLYYKNQKNKKFDHLMGHKIRPPSFYYSQKNEIN
jgi:methionyl-tRNA formyltransferase